MGGDEYDTIAGDARVRCQPSLQSLASVLKKHAIALPPFAKSGGPFAGHEGRLVNAQGLDSQERAALATVYCALQTDFLLDLLGNGVVEGPLATNPLYGRLLATFRPTKAVCIGDYRGSSATECARFLARTPADARGRTLTGGRAARSTRTRRVSSRMARRCYFETSFLRSATLAAVRLEGSEPKRAVT